MHFVDSQASPIRPKRNNMSQWVKVISEDAFTSFIEILVKLHSYINILVGIVLS